MFGSMLTRQSRRGLLQFGHCDSPLSWARHLRALRGVQRRTSGITEFVRCLPGSDSVFLTTH